jgi:hypothetical protein
LALEAAAAAQKQAQEAQAAIARGEAPPAPVENQDIEEVKGEEEVIKMPWANTNLDDEDEPEEEEPEEM